MWKITVRQIAELIKQSEAGRITSGILQAFLENPMKQDSRIRPLTLEEYSHILLTGRINSCDMSSCHGYYNRKIDHYPHSDGWLVEGFDERQWLSIKCDTCGYNLSLSHLGVPKTLFKNL